MTASEIINICVTVAVVQALCDLLAYWRVFSKEPYARALEKRSRALFRKEKAAKDAAKENVVPGTAAEASSSSSSKKPSGKAVRAAKTLERAEQDLNDANANVTRYFMGPQFMTSMVFIILMRVLGTEHKGEIMGLLPFVPFQFIQRITARGLEFSSTLEFEPTNEKAAVQGVGQACSFVFIYFLAGFSIKFYVNRIFGSKAPGGADTVMSITQSTWAKPFLEAAGVDPKELKAE